MGKSDIHIRVEPSSADPMAARFVVSHKLAEGGPFLFDAREEALGQPMAEALLVIPGLDSIAFTDNVLSVRLSRGTSLTDIAREVGRVLRTGLENGHRPMTLAPRPAAVLADDAALAQAVRKVLDTEVNPNVAGHGGQIQLVKLEEGVAYLQMSGGCQGCGAAQMTLRSGVEVSIKRQVPGVRQVVDITDHSKGASPYYRVHTDLGPSPLVR